MKQFLKDKKITYNLMSFTGYKALVLFNLLTDEPKSYKEICDYFANHPYLREKISIDTLRVYINSLKRLGCKVKRTRGKDKMSRYFIESHPFELKISKDQADSIVRVCKNLFKNIDVRELLMVINFLEKINLYTDNEQFVESIQKLAMLHETSKELIVELLNCCDKKEQIVIEYESPKSGVKDIEIVADKMDINNGKIYLCGLGLEYNEYGIFPVTRINKLKEIRIDKKIPKEIESLTVVYELSLYNGDIHLDEDEKLIEKKDDKAIIEITSSNKFLLRQKFLALGPSCKILSPQEFKNEFINYLSDMKAGYYFG